VARERIFRPLGITDHFWEANVDGVTLGAHALWLRPRDLAKLGQHTVVVAADRLVIVYTALPDTNDRKLGNGLGPFLSVVGPLLGVRDDGQG